jgi:hypothetical protein
MAKVGNKDHISEALIKMRSFILLLIKGKLQVGRDILRRGILRRGGT